MAARPLHDGLSLSPRNSSTSSLGRCEGHLLLRHREGGTASCARCLSSMHVASIKEDMAQGCDIHYKTGSVSPVSRARLIGKNTEKLERQHTAAMCGECVDIHTQLPSQGCALFADATGPSFLIAMAAGLFFNL
jgi:hypothetical protein